MQARTLMLLLGLLGALLLSTLWSAREAHWARAEATRYKGVAEEATAQAEATQARLGRIQLTLRAAEAARQATERRMQEVLDAEHEWGAGAVPDAVSDGLCSTLRCD